MRPYDGRYFLRSMGSVVSRVRSRTGHLTSSRTSLLRDFLGIGLGIVGTAVAIFGLIESKKTGVRSARVEAYVYLDTAMDLLGGQPGTSSIVKPVRDPGKLEEARRAIERALVLEPNSARAFRIKGIYFWAKGELPDAIRSLETSIALDPSDYRSHAALGVLYMYAEDYPKAEQELVTGTRLSPSNHVIVFNLGVLSAKQRKFTRALSYYDRAIRLEPTYEAAYNLKGAAWRSLAREPEACMCFAHAAEIRKDYSLAGQLRSRANRLQPAPAPKC